MMEGFDPAAAQFEAKLDLINAYTTDRFFPSNITRRIKTHFENSYNRTTIFDAASADSASSLSPAQAYTLICIQYKSLINSLSFLEHNPPLFVKDLVQCMKPAHASNNEIISRWMLCESRGASARDILFLFDFNELLCYLV